MKRDEFEDRMHEELEFHLRQRQADLERQGLSPDEAGRRARLEFGSRGRVEEESRAAAGFSLLDEFGRNVRFAIRSLWSAKAYTFASIATLGLCLGLNTTLLTVAEQALWRPLPYPEQDRLFNLITYFRSSKGDGSQESQTGHAWTAMRDHRNGLDWAVYSDWSSTVNLNRGDTASSVLMQRVSTGFFRVLGAPLEFGREFVPEEDAPNGPPAAILSREFCDKVFGWPQGILGQRILLRGEPHVVVGILARGFQSTVPADVFTPLKPNTQGEGGGQNYRLVGRLRQGPSLAGARGQVTALSRQALGEERDGVTSWVDLRPLVDSKSGSLRKPIAVFAGAALVVLLIGCLNLAALSLSRFLDRRRELATRVALGGGRIAIVRQLLTESLIVALAGGAVGTVVGVIGLEALKRTAPLSYSLLERIHVDGRSLLISFGLTLLTVLVFALWPAWRAAALEVRSGLVSGERGSSEGGTRWPRRALIFVQTSLALAFLIQAALLLRTFDSLMGLSPGFDPTGVMTARVSLDDARYHEAAAATGLFDRALAELARQGYPDAAASLSLPYERALNMPVDVAGREGRQTVNLHYVRGRYLDTLRIPVFGGSLAELERAEGGEPVAVVNRAFARMMLKEDLPVGKYVLLPKPYRIVAVVGDVQQSAGWGGYGPLAPIPAVYVRLSDMSGPVLKMVHTWFTPALFARGAPDSAMRAAFRKADPLLPVSKIRSMDEIRGQAASMQRFHALLFGLMATVALILATVGLSGLVASHVARRSREIGIRMALGARPGVAAVTVVRPIALVVLCGLLAGGALAAFGNTVLKGLLYGVTPLDTTSWAFAAGLLLAASAAGLLPPLLRVLRINPATALRDE